MSVMSDAFAMSARKRPPETELERLERLELIGRQIAEAINLDGEPCLQTRRESGPGVCNSGDRISVG